MGRYKTGGINYYAYMCPWDAKPGYLTWTQGVGFVLKNIGEDGQLVMEFRDNGKWGSYTCTSMHFSGWQTNSPGSSGRKTLVSSQTYFQTMTKK